MNYLKLVAAMLAAATASTPAAAAQFAFNFNTTSTLFGGPTQTIQGVFTTSDTPVDRFGFSGLEITGISGTINGVAISGLYTIAGNPYYYLTSGPTFLDGSGVRFNAGAAQNIAFFHQDNVASDIYRVNGNGTISAFGTASSSAVTATSAVAEPGTWMLMLLGFGAVGYAARRRSGRTGAALHA
ncbi:MULTISPECIES: PEPxxWA-CTERM sorting domain-containing protein [Sphingomonas]|uniref:PEPxxWA-CTERM sorting domain-containing protein n=1 Tax=Sphingomonas TaxID=13687 RepID=UPI001F0850A1|nr:MULTISPECIES: PEPxxWA-CTERM sorting domain-containing protein [Sphingomonas]